MKDENPVVLKRIVRTFTTQVNHFVLKDKGGRMRDENSSSDSQASLRPECKVSWHLSSLFSCQNYSE